MNPSESENIRKKGTWKMEREQEKSDRDRDNGVGCIASYVASFLCKCLSFDSPVVLISLRLISIWCDVVRWQRRHDKKTMGWCAQSGARVPEWQCAVHAMPRARARTRIATHASKSGFKQRPGRSKEVVGRNRSPRVRRAWRS